MDALSNLIFDEIYTILEASHICYVYREIQSITSWTYERNKWMNEWKTAAINSIIIIIMLNMNIFERWTTN